jgi:hypothetical protein
MKAIFYEITDTKVPNLVKDFHLGLGLGYAYETDTHYIHFYGTNRNWFSIHTGQTVIENKSESTYKTLKEWVEFYFGARNIQTMSSNIGESVEGVWRSGLFYYDDTNKALNTNEAERRLSEQALRVLLEKLDDLFLYVEPDTISFNTYSHKIRELLILACTEVENFWSFYMHLSGTRPIGRNYSTQDYVKLLDKLFLKEFQCSLRSYVSLPAIKPFENWNTTNPTTSLVWYDAYNKTKHNRASHFTSATLSNALSAVIANIILYIVRFSPYPLLEENGTFNSLINQHFRFELINADITKSYIPLLEIPSHYRKDIFIYDSRKSGDVKPYTINPLSL